MKKTLAPVFLALASSLWAAGESAVLSANATRLSPRGGEVTCTAVVMYPQAPDAIGWVVPLPKGWSIESTSGPNIPEVSPAKGADAGEWAFISIPASRAQFSFVVKYPAGAKSADLKATVYVRGKGDPVTLTPPAVSLKGAQ